MEEDRPAGHAEFARLPPTSIPVEQLDSDLIHSWGYSKGVLGVVFRKSMDFWEYMDVPEAVAREMQRSKSKGSYFERWVKPAYVARLVRRGKDPNPHANPR